METLAIDVEDQLQPLEGRMPLSGEAAVVCSSGEWNAAVNIVAQLSGEASERVLCELLFSAPVRCASVETAALDGLTYQSADRS